MQVLKLIKRTVRFIFRYSGLEAVASKFTGKQTNAPSGMLWLFGIYVALYGWVQQRERSYWEMASRATQYIRDQALSAETKQKVIAQLDEESSLSRDEWCEVWQWGLFPVESYLEPDFFKPVLVILSLSDRVYPQPNPTDPIDMAMISRAVDEFESWGYGFPDGIEVAQLPNNKGLDSAPIWDEFFERYGGDPDSMSRVCKQRLIDNDWDYPRGQTEFYVCRQLIAELKCLGN